VQALKLFVNLLISLEDVIAVVSGLMSPGIGIKALLQGCEVGCKGNRTFMFCEVNPLICQKTQNFQTGLEVL
jgi:hypothetical protein